MTEPSIREEVTALFLRRAKTFSKEIWEDGGMKKFKNTKAKAKASVQGSGSRVQVAVVGKAAPSKRSKTARGDTNAKAKSGSRKARNKGTARGDSRPTGSTSKRRRLVKILQEHGVSVAGFDTLRADAYERRIAARSLDELSRFYGLLQDPAGGYMKIAPECPGWGPRNRPPHWTTLRNIKNRLNHEQMVRERMGLKTVVSDNSGPSEQELLDATIRTLGQELMMGKLDGKPIGENLKMFDRLLRVAGLRVRERKESREQAEFEWFKQGQPITEPEVSPETNDGTQSIIDGRTRPSGEDRTDDIIERIYGPNPFKAKPVDPNAKPYLQVVDPASDQPKPAWWTPGTVLIAGPSQKYPMGVRRHVVSGNPHCVATMICVDVESEEFRAIYDETGTAKEIRNPNDEIRNAKGDKAEGEKRKAETNKGVQCSVSSVQNPSARATDGNNKDAKGAKAENGKPKWWKPGSILIAGPSAEYPKGVGKDVITGRLYCVATGKAACVENAESKSEKKQPNSEVVKPDMATGKSPEPAGKNACPTSAPQSAPVESLEEYTARKRKEAEQKAWEARQARIRDKTNGTEKYFYPPGYGPNN